MLIVHGIYHFLPKRLAFRNDYCLSCAQPRRSIQVRTLDILHVFWIPMLPVGVWSRWFCTICGNQPRVSPRTRRPFKWLGLVVLLFFSVISWTIPVDSDFEFGSWVFRIGAPIGATLTLVHLMRTPPDKSLDSLLAGVQRASDIVCPFCGTSLVATPEWTCPTCGVIRK